MSTEESCGTMKVGERTTNPSNLEATIESTSSILFTYTGNCKSAIQNPSEVSNVSKTAIANIKSMKMYLEFDEEMQKENLDMILRFIQDLHQDIKDERIPQKLYTEENLSIILNIFEISVKQEFPPAIRSTLRDTLNHWYQRVKLNNIRDPKKKVEKSVQVFSNTKRPRASKEEVKRRNHYACPCCSQAYRRRSDCKNHMKKVHPYSSRFYFV